MIRCWHWGDVPLEYSMDTNSGGDEELVFYVPPALVPASWRAMWDAQRQRDAAEPYGIAAFGEPFVGEFRIAEWRAAYPDEWGLAWLHSIYSYQHVFEHPSGGAFVRIEH